jgi:hypothetical protein
LLPNDSIIVRKHGDDNKDEWDIKGAAREARICAHQGGNPIQFGIPKFDFESKLESRTISTSI